MKQKLSECLWPTTTAELLPAFYKTYTNKNDHSNVKYIHKKHMFYISVFQLKTILPTDKISKFSAADVKLYRHKWNSWINMPLVLHTDHVKKPVKRVVGHRYNHLSPIVLRKERPLVVIATWTGKNFPQTGGWETLF